MAVVVSVVMFVCSTQVRRETLGLIGVCFSKVWLLFYSCGLPLNGSASPFTTKFGGNIQAAQISPHYVAVEPCYVAPWPDCWGGLFSFLFSIFGDESRRCLDFHLSQPLLSSAFCAFERIFLFSIPLETVLYQRSTITKGLFYVKSTSNGVS